MRYRQYIATSLRLERMKEENTQEKNNLDDILKNQCNQNNTYITDNRNGLVYDITWIRDRLSWLEEDNKSIQKQIDLINDNPAPFDNVVNV